MALTARTLIRWFLVAVAVFLVAAQFLPVARTNPSSDPEQHLVARLSPPPPVASALDRSCRDCHSNSTTWPWYSRVAPFSWIVADDVKTGRRHLNLSEWGKYDTHRAAEKLNEICEQVKTGEMPDFKYTLIHREARLSESEVQGMCTWALSERQRLLDRTR